MRMLRLLAGIVSGLVLLSGCLCGLKEEKGVDEILAGMRKAIDPEGAAAKITTQIIESSIKTSKGSEGDITVEIKYPKEIRIKADSNNGVFMRGYDGSKAWEFSTKAGLREIKGRELEDLKFQIVFISPKVSFKDVFESITVDGEEAVNKNPCYRLICKPRQEFNFEPITFFVDKNTFLVAKTQEIHHSANGDPVELTRFYMNYEKTDGIYYPMNIISEAGGNLIELDVKSVKWNEDLSSSAFDMPEVLEMDK